MLFRRPMFLRRFRYGYSELFPLFFITCSLKLLIAAERQQARGNQKAWDGGGNTRPLESANKSLTRHHRLLVSVRRVLESYESPVIQEWWPDSRRGRRCGRARTAPVTTAASCDIRAI